VTLPPRVPVGDGSEACRGYGTFFSLAWNVVRERKREGGREGEREQKVGKGVGFCERFPKKPFPQVYIRV